MIHQLSGTYAQSQGDGMRPVRQFYFTPTYTCNSDCIMCGVEKAKRDRGDKFSLDECKSLIDQMQLAPDDLLEFSGGEPTLYKGFRELVIYAKQTYNPRIVVLSHGRSLNSEKFAASMRNIGIERFIIPLFSDSAEKHDDIAQAKGAFAQTCRGFNRLEAHGIPYSIKFIAMSLNYMDMENVYRLKREQFSSARFIISGYQLMGQAVTNRLKIGTRHSHVSPHIESTLDCAEHDNDFVPVFMFPMCLIDPYYWKYFGVGVYREEVIAPDQNDVMLNSKLNYEQKAPKCAGCLLTNRCTWAWKNYVREYGDGELSPVRGGC